MNGDLEKYRERVMSELRKRVLETDPSRGDLLSHPRFFKLLDRIKEIPLGEFEAAEDDGGERAMARRLFEAAVKEASEDRSGSEVWLKQKAADCRRAAAIFYDRRGE